MNARNCRSVHRACSARSGFTLIELLVVILIIAILMSLLLVALITVNRSAAETNSIQNLHQIGAALKAYVTQYKLMPPAEAWGLGGGSPSGSGDPSLPGSGVLARNRPLNRFLSNDQQVTIFESPSDRGIFGFSAITAFELTGSSYVYVARGGGYPSRRAFQNISLDDPPELGSDIMGVASDPNLMSGSGAWQSPNDFEAPAKKLVVMDPSLYMPNAQGGRWSILLEQNQRHNVRNVSYSADSGGTVGQYVQQGCALFLDGSAKYLLRDRLPGGWAPAVNPKWDPNAVMSPSPTHDWY